MIRHLLLCFRRFHRSCLFSKFYACHNLLLFKSIFLGATLNYSLRMLVLLHLLLLNHCSILLLHHIMIIELCHFRRWCLNWSINLWINFRHRSFMVDFLLNYWLLGEIVLLWRRLKMNKRSSTATAINEHIFER